MYAAGCIMLFYPFKACVPFKVIGKQCKLRSDAADCLHYVQTFLQNMIIISTKQTPLIQEMGVQKFREKSPLGIDGLNV